MEYDGYWDFIPPARTQEATMHVWYFTFGCGSPLAKYYVTIAAPDELTARAKMVAWFSTHWASVYPADVGRDVVARYLLQQLDVNESAGLRLGTNHDDLSPDLYQLAYGGPP